MLLTLSNFCLKVCSLMGKVKGRVPFSRDIPHCWPSRQKLCTLITHEERHAVRRWDPWHEQHPSLQTAVFFISLWKKLPFINLSRQLGIPSVVLSSVHLSWLELAQMLLKGTGMMPCFCMDKEDAMRRFNARSLRQNLFKGLDHYFKDSFCAHPPCRRAQGGQDC